MEVRDFTIDIKSIIYGCEELVMSFDKEEVKFTPTCLGNEPVTTLINSLIALKEEDDALIVWLDEPGKWMINLNKNFDSLKIRVNYDNGKDAQYNYKYVKEYEIKYQTFKRAVIKTALVALRRYGLKGFDVSWGDGLGTFPICALIDLLGSYSVFDIEEEIYHSSIFDEIEILRKALKTL